MPFVLQHTGTSQIYTCRLINQYQLEYYGTKFWESEKEAQEYPAFLAERGIEDAALWKLIEISEQQLKLCNVKLKNDPLNRLYWYDSKPLVQRMS
jgi:translation initiation factor 2 alpha subunit (eIF-2alpha)